MVGELNDWEGRVATWLWGTSTGLAVKRLCPVRLQCVFAYNYLHSLGQLIQHFSTSLSHLPNSNNSI